MKCISSPALDDFQIVSYVEGEADDAVVAHINQCQFCSERANRWTLLQNQFRKQLYRSNCPTSVELGDYHLGLLTAPQALIVSQHLRECALCSREVAELEEFLADPVPEVGLLRAAKLLIARLVNGNTEPGRQVNDGFTQVSVHALRGEVKGPLTFKADGIVIVLDIQPTSDGKANLLGQVAADSAEDQDQWTGALVELRQDKHLEFSATLDDLGSFQYQDIIPGPKELQITKKDGSLIVVSSFDVSI